MISELQNYDTALAYAERMGWKTPVNSALPQRAWMDYWLACEKYERLKAAGEKDPGRPVAPHRSAGQ